MVKKVLITCVIAAFALAGATGCSSENNTSSETTPSADATVVAEGPEKSLELCGTTADALTAIETVMQEAGGTIVGIERSDSNKNWEVKYVNDNQVFKVEVSCDGKSLGKTKDKGDLDADDMKKIESVKVPIAEAIKSVEKPDSILDEAELDDKDNLIVWEMSFDDNQGNDLFEELVDVGTGKIIK